MVRDGSRSNSTKADEARPKSTTQPGEVRADPQLRANTNHPQTLTTTMSSAHYLTAFRVRGPSINQSAASATTQRTTTLTRMDRDRARLLMLGSGPSATEDNKADVTHEAGETTGRQDRRPVTASLSPPHATDTTTTSRLLPKSTAAPHNQLQSREPLKYVEMKATDPNIYLKDLNVLTLNHQTTFAAVPSTNHKVSSTRPEGDSTHNVRDLDQSRPESSSQPWRSVTKMAQTPHLKPFLQSHTSSPRMFFKAQSSPSFTLFTRTSDALPASPASTPEFSHPQTSLLNAEPSSKSPTPPPALTPHSHALNHHTSAHYRSGEDSPEPQPEASRPGLRSEPREASATSAPVSSPQQQPFSKGQTPEGDTPARKHESQPEALSIFYQAHSQTEARPVDTSKWDQSQPSVKPRSSDPTLPTPGQEDVLRTDLEIIRSTRPASAFVTNIPYFPVFTQRSPSLSSLSASTRTFPVSPLARGSFTTSRSALGSKHPSLGIQPKTAAAILALPSPLPISIPPDFPSTSPVPSSSSATVPSSTALLSHLPSSLSSPSSFTSSRRVTASASSFSTVSFSSSVSSSASPPSHSYSTTSHPGPSPAPRRSLYHPPVSSASPVPLRVTVGQRLLIHNHMVSSSPELSPPTPRTMLDPNFKGDFGPNTGNKAKHPSVPSKSPDEEGKYPDIVPRHSAWELGMLLGCSAGLGMVLVVGLRYMYRQACGRKTEMTLNDREREYGRGERGLIHVQECGDLVRVRRIRENSFVLLAEYDILASPGD